MTGKADKKRSLGGLDMFIQYGTNDYDKIRKQHNIMVLVGNGFDIAALNQCKRTKMSGKNTSYEDFYEYVKYFDICREDNCLFKKMKQDREADKKNWSDFENSIDELLAKARISVDELEQGLEELQNAFTRFLNDIVTADVLIEVNEFSQENQLAMTSLSKFLGDLDKESKGIRFPKALDHYDLFNFLFVNFNYTMLLDNYIHLDKKQFDPHKYLHVDRNFDFYPYPGRNDTRWSSYVLTDVIHPHGVQSIPRSMIFGTEKSEYDKTDKKKRMMKSYWAQNDLKYRRYFNDTELFIVYGMSLSRTDGWWWDRIFEMLLEQKSELIIYYFGECDSEEIKCKYLQSCISHDTCSTEDQEKVFERIYVVRLKDNNNYFLGFSDKQEV